MYLLRAKSEAIRYLIDSSKLVETQFGKKVKCIQSNNRLGFDSTPMREFYRDYGIYMRLLLLAPSSKIGKRGEG